MTQVKLKDIYIDGEKFLEDEHKIIYLTPKHPLRFDSNTWVYKTMPSMSQWLEDIDHQRMAHQNQYSNHLSFYFPENVNLNQQWLDLIQRQGFELGLLELYAIEGYELQRLTHNHLVTIQQVTKQNIDDYLRVHENFTRPFGEKYAKESAIQIKENYMSDVQERLIAYFNHQPVGIVDLIINTHTIEIDGLGVIEQYRHQLIGSTIQAYVGDIAQSKTVILVADGEDTAKDMYLQQGYTYLSYRYQVLNEDINLKASDF